MRILFTKLRHIGDNLLLTPIISATRRKFPDAEIWVVVRRGTEGILAGCPEIDKVLVSARPEGGSRSRGDFWEDLGTLGLIARTRFDYAFEVGDNDRGRMLAVASGAPVRATHEGELGLSAFWRFWFTRVETGNRSFLHQVERDYMVPAKILGLETPPPPLRFDPGMAEPWQGLPGADGSDFAVLHAATRWESKSWPMERWKEVIGRLLEFTSQVVVSCGPSSKEVADAHALSEGFGGRVISTNGKTSWRQLAWLLARARYFVGVDTAAMHLAAAMQCPSATLFGQTIPEQFGPWRAPHIMIAPAGRREGEPEIPSYEVSDRMLAITTNEVVEACRKAAAIRASA